MFAATIIRGASWVRRGAFSLVTLLLPYRVLFRERLRDAQFRRSGNSIWSGVDYTNSRGARGRENHACIASVRTIANATCWAAAKLEWNSFS